MLSEWIDPADPEFALGADGLLAVFNRAGVLNAADVHVAIRMGATVEETDETVLLALACAVRAARSGAVCVDLSTVADAPVDVTDDVTLPWPEPDSWTAAVGRSPLVGEQVVRLDGTLLYLDRYWREEQQVCDDLVARLRRIAPPVDEALLDAGVARVFPAQGYDEQRAAARAAVGRWTTILTGGPGTGKTTTVARLLVLVAEQHEAATGRRPRIALCAPTGKAAARLHEAVHGSLAELDDEADRERLVGLTASTLHRLLGWRPDSSVRFRHNRSRRLPYDIVVVDESSMVSLTMMARLLEALRPETRLVLVGDPDQLASVEAGAVLADLVAGFAGHADSPVSSLLTTHRYGEHIGALAHALRVGDADAVMEQLAAESPDVGWVRPDDTAAMAAFHSDLTAAVADLHHAAEHGDVDTVLRRLGEHRLLCAHRRGPYGVAGWNALVEQLVAERTGVVHYQPWYAGRPVLVNSNDRGLRIFNGDTGVTVRLPDGRLRVFLDTSDEVRDFATTRLADVDTLYAMTIHKSQGSQARVVSVALPPEDSPLLTRELFYTAVTRAQERVRVIGTEASVRAAVARQVQRASGLREHLRDALAAAAN